MRFKILENNWNKLRKLQKISKILNLQQLVQSLSKHYLLHSQFFEPKDIVQCNHLAE